MTTKIFYRLFVLLVTFSLSCNFATGLIGAGDDPTNLTAILTAPDVVLLTWDSVDGAIGYDLEMSVDNGDSFTIASLPSERTSYEDLTAPEKSKLTYQVQVLTESGPAGKSKVEIETGERKPNPLTVKPAYDEENAIVATIGTQGGTVSLVDSNEVKYTLNIPKGALSADTEIRMTAVTSIQDWPLDGNPIGAVRLEPEGLVLNDVAILTIGFPVDVNPDLSIVGFAFQANGEEFHLQPSDEVSGLTNKLPFAGAHLASLAFQKPNHDIQMTVVEFKVGGVGQASGDSVSQYAKDHAPTNSGAALEQKWAAESAADDELAPLTGLTDPVAKQASLINQAISKAKNCKELNSAIVSFQMWRYDTILQGMSNDRRRAVEKQIWDDLTDKVKEVLENAATDCEKSSESGSSASANSPCAKALLEKITNPPAGTATEFNLELKNKLANKLSDTELQDIKEKLEKCKAKVYTVSGTSGPVTFNGVVCLDKPFDLAETFATGSGTVSFTPSSKLSGVVSDASNSGGCEQSGGGSYTINLNEDGSGELQWTIAIHASCPPYSKDGTYTFVLPLQPAPNLSCP